MDIKNLPDCIASCVVLHKACELRGDHFDDLWITPSTDSHSEEGFAITAPAMHQSAEATRTALMQHFQANPL